MLVRVPDVSVDLYFANSAQLADNLLRVWAVVRDRDGGLPLSAGDSAAIEDILHRYRSHREAVTEQASVARARGQATFTLEIDLPASAADDIAYLTRRLVRIEELSAEQGLLLPAPPEVRAFRLALFAAIAGQLQPN